MPKPTATELIERIDEWIKSYWSSKETVIGLFTDLRANLNDPWISVEERLPEGDDEDDFLVLNTWGMSEVASLGLLRELATLRFTHWCPLHPLPKKAGEA